MAKMENKGKCKSVDNQMIDFSCLSMISVLCTGCRYCTFHILPSFLQSYKGPIVFAQCKTVKNKKEENGLFLHFSRQPD